MDKEDIRNKKITCIMVTTKKRRWNLISVMMLIVCCMLPTVSSFCPIGSGLISPIEKSRETTSILATLESPEGPSKQRTDDDLSSSLEKMPLWKIFQLTVASSLLAVLVIFWEDLSMAHPMRQYAASEPLESTVRGLAFGQRERLALQSDSFEPEQMQAIKSYNEVMLQHRTERVPTWEGVITEKDVRQSVATIQRAVLFIEECKALASNYEWETLSSSLKDPILHSELETACGILKRADAFLSSDVREVVGFDWASCAWRHCGAFADAQEAIDELDHLIGILEPFEGLFILDIVERSFRDILAVTQARFGDASIVLTDYKPLERMADGGAESEGTLDEEYLAALEFLRQIEE